MNRIALYLFACLVFSPVSNSAQRKIAYEQGQNVFVSDVDGKHAKKIAAGASRKKTKDSRQFIGCRWTEKIPSCS
jgi:hypothetical protein